jgi:hypothetical protein
MCLCQFLPLSVVCIFHFYYYFCIIPGVLFSFIILWFPLQFLSLSLFSLYFSLSLGLVFSLTPVSELSPKKRDSNFIFSKVLAAFIKKEIYDFCIQTSAFYTQPRVGRQHTGTSFLTCGFRAASVVLKLSLVRYFL